MTVWFAVCAGATLLFAAPSFAGSVALQTVDLNDKEMSTTMAFVRMLGNMLKDAELGPRVVPVVAEDVGFNDVGEIVNVHGTPACVTVKVWPPIVIVPVRDVVAVFAATL